jgi:hypothetical protein
VGKLLLSQQGHRRAVRFVPLGQIHHLCLSTLPAMGTISSRHVSRTRRQRSSLLSEASSASVLALLSVLQRQQLPQRQLSQHLWMCYRARPLAERKCTAANGTQTDGVALPAVVAVVQVALIAAILKSPLHPPPPLR